MCDLFILIHITDLYTCVQYMLCISYIQVYVRTKDDLKWIKIFRGKKRIFDKIQEYLEEDITVT